LDVLNNIQNSILYFDSTITNIKHFTPTLPTLGFKKPSKPIFLIDANIKKIKHHDGHLSDLNYTKVENDNIITLLKLSPMFNELVISEGNIKINNKGLFKFEDNKLYRCNTDSIMRWTDEIWDIVNFDDMYNKIQHHGQLDGMKYMNCNIIHLIHI
jgi:hypothetical protein